MNTTDRAARSFNAAAAALEAGFSSKAAVKTAIEDATRAYEYGFKGVVHTALLAVAREDRSVNWDELYWGVPDLHVWKPKHAALFAEFADAVAYAQTCADLRAAIKAAPITPKAPKNDRVEAVVSQVRDLIELRKEQYGRALHLHEIFGRLPVTASWHWVVNEHGTEFTRVFFYLAGRLTPLNIILAALDATEEK